MQYLDEMHEGDRVRVSTQVLEGGPKKMHLFHRMMNPAGEVAATMETFLLHVDLGTRRSAPARADVAEALAAFGQAHAGMPRPEGAVRYVGQRG